MTSRPSKVDVVVRLANGGRLTPEDLALIEAVRKERSILAASRTTSLETVARGSHDDSMSKMSASIGSSYGQGQFA
jgi:hypothetical protein